MRLPRCRVRTLMIAVDSIGVADVQLPFDVLGYGVTRVPDEAQR